MRILELLEEVGITPRRTAATNGGEYHSPCPSCGGEDRFCIWPKQGDHGRYWCRQCEKKGGTIRFCMDFMKLSYKGACEKLRIPPKENFPSFKQFPYSFYPKLSESPSTLWKKQAKHFLDSCKKVDSNFKPLSSELRKRGINMETALKCQLSYNLKSQWAPLANWDLEHREGIKAKSVWLPKGFVIPTFKEEDSFPHKLKIRRDPWSPEDSFPKYVEVSGSQKQYSVFGNFDLPIVLVEAELDAILLQQEAEELCCAVALGGLGKRPDEHLHRVLRSAPILLFSLDFDSEGKKAFTFWRRTYSRVFAWPVPIGKSPAEAFQLGICLRNWVLMGIRETSKGR